MTEKNKNYEIIKGTLKSEQSLQMFAEVFGSPRQAHTYIASALLAIRNNDLLMDCTAGSVATSALRAATLRLSCDPGIGQAYLVPFKGKATLVIGYKGLKDLAIRTGKYRYLNVATVREGMIVEEDFLTGQHTIKGGPISQKAIGYLLYFELMNGFTKTFYMSVEEIHLHAQKYSKSYSRSDSPWKTNVEQMEKKTVLRLGLSRWGYFDPADMVAINQVDESDDENIVEGLIMADEDEPPQISEQQAMEELGFE